MVTYTTRPSNSAQRYHRNSLVSQTCCADVSFGDFADKTDLKGVEGVVHHMARLYDNGLTDVIFAMV